jgi:hypothetical protein
MTAPSRPKSFDLSRLAAGHEQVAGTQRQCTRGVCAACRKPVGKRKEAVGQSAGREPRRFEPGSGIYP